MNVCMYVCMYAYMLHIYAKLYIYTYVTVPIVSYMFDAGKVLDLHTS